MKLGTLILASMMAPLPIAAQNIVITFQGTFNAVSTPLDSIRVMNLVQGSDTTIVFPDNILVLGTTGMPDRYGTAAAIQSWPNPFAGSTDIAVASEEQGELVLTVHDATGREVAAQRIMAQPGVHHFRFATAQAGVHVVGVTKGGQRSSLRLVAMDGAGARGSQLSYLGPTGATPEFKSGRSLFTWEPGEALRYIAYARSGDIVLSEAIDEVPVASITHTFNLLHGAVCPDSPTVTDLDGNVYRAVQVGNQCWMAQELRTGTYANGDPIPNVTGSAQWIAQTTGAWCHTDNDPSYEVNNGRLYNWYAVTDPRNVCPSGWHAASDAEWITLELALGMPQSEATMFNFTRGSLEFLAPKLRSVNGWVGGPLGIDAVGVALRPTARRNSSGTFLNQNNGGYWWSTDVMGPSNGLVRLFGTSNNGVVRTLHDRHNGAGVRCVRD
ncbi:MAG: fibrobacter succinogenes major paralogous domain-containing protein [Flavobacteriales bacterium]|nr:fibrobacter succinogenes major paralogous domain-containing protein [Flavobacteriales bacterium]